MTMAIIVDTHTSVLVLHQDLSITVDIIVTTALPPSFFTTLCFMSSKTFSLVDSPTHTDVLPHQLISPKCNNASSTPFPTQTFNIHPPPTSLSPLSHSSRSRWFLAATSISTIKHVAVDQCMF